MSDHFDKLRAAIAQAEARALPPMDADQLLRDLRDQVLDPIKRNGLRTLLDALTANKTEQDMPSVTQAFLEQAPAVVGADLWRACCEKQRPPDTSSDDSWRCSWCKNLKNRQQYRGPHGETLCDTCNDPYR